MSEPWSGQSWNLYSYVGNSPVSYADPTGLFRAGPCCNVAGVMCLDDGGGPGGGHANETTTLTSTRVGFGFLPRPVFAFRWTGLRGTWGRGGDLHGRPDWSFGGFPVLSVVGYVNTPYAWTDVRPADGPMATSAGDRGAIGGTLAPQMLGGWSRLGSGSSRRAWLLISARRTKLPWSFIGCSTRCHSSTMSRMVRESTRQSDEGLGT